MSNAANCDGQPAEPDHPEWIQSGEPLTESPALKTFIDRLGVEGGDDEDKDEGGDEEGGDEEGGDEEGGDEEGGDEVGGNEEGGDKGDVVLSSVYCNSRERCYVHLGGKQKRMSWRTDARDKCACPECLEEKRRFLEDVEYAHLPESERKLKTFVQMGAYFCTGCLRTHIAENKPFVSLAEDGFVRSSISCAKICKIQEHKIEHEQKLCDCEFSPKLWMNCIICADKNPRAGTIYCKTCKNLKLSSAHRLCPDYVPKERRFRVKKRVLDKKKPDVRARKPTLTQLLLKERGILRPSAVRSVAGPSTVALFQPKPSPVIGGNGAFASRAPQHAMVAAFQEAVGKRRKLDSTSAEGI